jgi:hypothetical protein
LLFVLVAAAALALALLLGGRLSALGEARLRGLWLLVIAGALKLFELAAPDSFLPALWPYLIPAQTLAVVAFSALNLRVPGVALVLLGSAANLAVVALNGGFMPVSRGAVAAAGGARDLAAMRTAGHVGTYTLLTSGTPLGWLGDTILLPWPLARALSLGDFVLAAGIAVSMLALARTPRPAIKAFALASFTKLRRFLTTS